ncbi:MAG TPA: cytochrome c oxidase assembly factor Coa1 family protein [Cellvibrionaceae bacterium]
MQKKWLIVLVISSFAGFCGFVFLATSYYKLFKGDAYYESIAAIQSHPEVIEQLGSPIKPSWFFSGNYFYNTLLVRYEISGTKADGLVYIEARKDKEAWTLDSVWVMPSNTDDFIIVLEPEPIPSSGGCNAPEDFNADELPEEDMEGIYMEPEEA